MAFSGVTVGITNMFPTKGWKCTHKFFTTAHDWKRWIIVFFSLTQNGDKVELTFFNIIVYLNVECYGVLCIEIHLPWNPLLQPLVVDTYNFDQNQIFDTIFQNARMI